MFRTSVTSVFAVSAFSGVFALEANPMRRVITLLQAMQKGLEDDSAKEQALYDKFECYCKKNTANMSAEAEAAKARIVELINKVEEATAQKQRTDQELEAHKKDREQAKTELAKATAIREKEKQDYLAATADQQQNIDALNKAIAAIAKGSGQAFFQSNGDNIARLRKIALTTNSNELADFERKELLSFVGLSQSPYGAYSSQTGEISGILKQIKDEMDRDLGGVVQREEKAAAAFEELKAAKLSEIQAHTSSIEEKLTRSGELGVEIVTAQQDLKDTRGELDEKTRFVADLAVSCDDKTKEWDERQKTRSDEISAISEAIKVLNDDDALDIFKDTLKTPGKPAGFGFLQKRKAVSSNRAMRARQVLLAAGSSHRSSNLGLLAYLLRGKNGSGAVDFSKVVMMIDQMTDVLKKEQQADVAHKESCTAEISNTEQNSKDTKRKISEYEANLAELHEERESLAGEVAALQESIKALDQSVADATSQRKKENAEYTSSQTELSAAVQLIEKAINKLNKFYNPALYKEAPKRQLTEEERIAKNLGDSSVSDEPVPTYIEGTRQTVYIQLVSKDTPAPPPETWDAYKTKGTQNNGVVALLNNLLKDLHADIQEGQHEEKTSQEEYEKMMTDAKQNRANAADSITNKQASIADLDEHVQQGKAELATSHQELQDVEKALAGLHASCDFLIANFVVREEARGNELAALANAKAILAGAKFE